MGVSVPLQLIHLGPAEPADTSPVKETVESSLSSSLLTVQSLWCCMAQVNIQVSRKCYAGYGEWLDSLDADSSNVPENSRTSRRTSSMRGSETDSRQSIEKDSNVQRDDAYGSERARARSAPQHDHRPVFPTTINPPALSALDPSISFRNWTPNANPSPSRELSPGNLATLLMPGPTRGISNPGLGDIDARRRQLYFSEASAEESENKIKANSTMNLSNLGSGLDKLSGGVRGGRVAKWRRELAAAQQHGFSVVMGAHNTQSVGASHVVESLIGQGKATRMSAKESCGSYRRRASTVAAELGEEEGEERPGGERGGRGAGASEGEETQQIGQD
eukprot:3358693-Rhodomonas_salina.1